VVIAAQYEMIIKQYFFWIHAKCDKTLLPSACRDAPITLNGKPVAQTETNGYAEFLHSGIPGKTVTIQIQTPNEELDGINPVSMIPANPTFSVKLDKDPHVYVIERTFSDRTGLEITAKPKSVRANRVKRKPRRSKRKSRTRRKPKKKPSNSGVIDIF
jgi:hypothetical protein